MKTLFTILIAGLVAAEAVPALTIEEYQAKTPEQKLLVLRGRPDRVLADTSQLLRLYSMSLKDSSLDVQRAAAQASVFLVMGLQEAKGLGSSPTFPERDSTELQRALVELLNHDDKATRISSVTALAYSSPPTSEIEKLLLSKISAEKDDEAAGGMLEAVAQAGYKSEPFVSEVARLFERTTDVRAMHSAGKVFGYLKPESALDFLILSAAKPTPSQRHAIQALGAYGAKALKARATLDALINDGAVQEDIRNLARTSVEAITTDHQQASSMKPMKLMELWPLAVESLPSAAPKQAPRKENAPPPVQLPATEPTDEPTSSTQRGLIALLIAVLLGLMLWLRKRCS